MALSILIFDSGVGGLTIYDSIYATLPKAHYTYLFDNQCFPYGELAEDELIARVSTVITAAVHASKPDIIVIACNSASTLALPALRERFSMPIVGVVPAIKPAAAITTNGVIGLLATPGTVMRSYTLALIEDFAFDKLVLPIGHSSLVALAENKMAGVAVDLDKLAEIISPWINNEISPDTIVLGCTHFPLIKDEIAQVLQHPVKFVDSGEAIGRRVKVLSAHLEKNSEQQTQKSRAYCTRLDQSVLTLQDNFNSYGFSQIKQLVI